MTMKAMGGSTVITYELNICRVEKEIKSVDIIAVVLSKSRSAQRKTRKIVEVDNRTVNS